MSHISNHLGDYNLVFVGSSRFGRQIDTELFDSLNADLGFHSYNYSFDAAFAPTSINPANELLELSNSHLKALILELTPIEFLGELNPSHVARSINWYNLDDFAFLLHSESRASVTSVEFARILVNRLYLFAHRIFSIGEFWKRVSLSKNNCESNDDPLEPLAELEKTPELLQELDDIRIANTTKNLASYQIDLSSSSYLKSLNQLEKKCAKQNIRLITVNGPRLKKEDIVYVESLAKMLNQQNQIRLNSSDEFPALYSAELTADAEHINQNGVPIFTKHLSSKIRSIVHPKINEQDERITL